VKVSHFPSHVSAKHIDISVIEIDSQGKILKYRGVPIL